MMVPTLYICQQVEQGRREDERRAARLWRLLRTERKQRRGGKGLAEQPAQRPGWAKELLGNPSL